MPEPARLLSPEQVRDIDDTFREIAELEIDDSLAPGSVMQARAIVKLCASHARLYEAVRALPFISYDYVAMEIQESAENTDIPHRRPLLEEEAEAWRTLAAIRAEMEDGE
jgi:hypothetical protein